MKQYKTTIIALIVIVVIVAGFFIISSFLDKKDPGQSSDPTEEETVSEKLFDIQNTGDIVFYESNLTEVLRMERPANGTWTCPTYPDITLNDSGLSSDFYALKEIMAVVVYEGEITEELLANYEISRTQYVKIGLADGREYTLRFGMQKPGTASSFAYVEQSKKIYLINSTNQNAAILTRETLLHTKLFSFNDNGKITSFAVLKSGKEIVSLTAEFEEDSRSWKMRYPLERKGDDKHVEEILTTVLSLYTMDYIDGNCEDLAQYGLDNPAYVLRLADNKSTQTMILGNKVPLGNAYYCLFGGEKSVFTVNAASLNFLDDSELKYMETTIYNQMYTDLKKIEIDVSCGEVNETFEMGFEIWEDGEQLYYNGTALPNDSAIVRSFRKIHTALYSVNLVGLEPEPQQKGERLLSIRYEESDGSQTIVECFRRDENTMSIYENGVYSGGYEYIRQITGTGDNYGIVGTLENFRSLSGMN